MRLPTVIATALLLSGGAVLGQHLNAEISWNNAALEGIRDSKLGAPVVARALAIVHTCMYDAWAAYDEKAVGTQLQGILRRPQMERTEANKEKAISYAAYRALTDVLSVDTDSMYIPLMKQLGFDPSDNSTDIETPAGIGNVACAAVLEFRHHDKSNQLGDLAPGPYSDWTGYVAVNRPSSVPVQAPVSAPNDWQPLIYVNSTGDLVTQRFSGAQWGEVTPFALSKGNEFRSLLQPFGPDTGPCGATTNADGQFQEDPGLSVCSTVCRVNNACVKAGPTNATQKVHVGSYIIAQSLSYYCDHVTVNGK